MKFSKQILSFVLAVIVLVNCSPLVYATDNSVLTVGDIYNAVTDVEYGWDGEVYRFSDDVLSGVKDGDEVYLVADSVIEPVSNEDNTAEVQLKAGVKINITLSDFRLEGADADKYEKPYVLNGMSVNKDIEITKKKIVIAPKHPYIYYGQSGPDSDTITSLNDFKEQIINDDIDNIAAEFQIENPNYNACGTYDLKLKNDIIVAGGAVENYDVQAAEDLKFSVLAYKTDETAASDNSSDDYVGVDSAVLNAPEGFLISNENNPDCGWSEKITIPLDETNSGEYTYYLRNNNASDSECYQAISEAKTYKYKSLQAIPEIYKIELNKTKPNTVLNFLTFGVFGNGEVIATVYAQSGKVSVDTTIYFGEDGDYESVIVNADDAVLEGEAYTYSATFKLDVDEGKSITKYYEAYAENACGAGKAYPYNGTNDKFYNADGATDTNVNSPVTVDKKEPDVEVIEIDGNYAHNSVRAEFTISDSGSGVAKIEYLWDEAAVNGASNYQNDFEELPVNSDGSSNYELVCPWSSLKKVDGNRHSLTLRVTDNAGNVCTTDPEYDDVGSDMLEPNIESIVFRSPKDGATDLEIDGLNFYEYGSFCNYPLDIIVKVNDNEDNADYYASGVAEVYITDQNGKLPLKRTENDNEFILSLALNTQIEDMKITVTDGNGLSTTEAAVNVHQHGALKSNDLLIEQNPPFADFEGFENMGHKDNDGNIWFGKADEDEEIIVKIGDDTASLSSGLQSVVITDIEDNNKLLYSCNSYSFKTNEDEISFKVGSFNDGKHKLEVAVVDNCGNQCTESIIFYKDTVKPEVGKVSTVAPESTVIDSNIWFDGEDDVVFRIDSSDDSSGVKEILLSINGMSFKYNAKSDSEGELNEIIFGQDGKCYVQLSAKDVPLNDNKYEVTGTITDFANNTVDVQPLTVYKDFENPTIDKITVEKKSDLLDKILSVLTFGIYSNDSLVVRVESHESENDSGIDYATIEYTGLDKPKKMSDDSNGMFLCELSVGDTVFASEIIITVYDKFGKHTQNIGNNPKITDVDGVLTSNENYVMLETAKPKIIPSVPKSEGVEINDGSIWYSENQEIVFEFSDADSGLSNIEFTVNGEPVENDKNGVALLKSRDVNSRINGVQKYVFDTDYFATLCRIVPKDGKYEIAAKATDNAGNFDTCTITYYLDKNDPVIDRIDFAPETVDGKANTSEFVKELNYGYYFNADFNVTVNVSDEGASSGLYKVNYRLVPYENGQKQEAITGSKAIVDGKAQLTIPKGFKGQIFVEAFDCVNRSSGEKTAKAYVVDGSAPNIKITNNVNTDYHDADGNKLYVEDNSFTVEITDTVSGIKQIGYSQASENGAFERKTVDIANTGYTESYDLGDGWIVTGTEANLVTQVTKVFAFDKDNNDVILTFDAKDNSLNESVPKQSEKFTVDKTAPIINVVFRDDDDSDVYYNSNRVADITVIERNFDASLVKIAIENTFGDAPTYSFEEKSKNEHTATVDFDEGDYTFDLTGTDLGAHDAVVNFSGGNEKSFHVDKTRPVVQENFSEFINSAENSFNADKTVSISVVEHNFDPELMNLKIYRKASGSQHNSDGFEDATSELLGAANWQSKEDVHTLSFTFAQDAVYYIEITPVDLAANSADKYSSAVFEIDKTAPVVSMKNGLSVSSDDTSFLDIYPYERKDDAAPTVEFYDFNISYIKYKLSVYIPEQNSSNEIAVNPVVSDGVVEGNKYTLPEFTKDGVYALELTAVDVAGNESALNLNTYARMINQDVLAFIMDSNAEKKSGLYSFEYENGQAVSKKPSSFEDLKIYVMAKKDTPVDIVLRDADGKEIFTNAQYDADDSIYGIGIYNYLLKADFFKENFQDDVDTELILSVKNENSRIDLGKMHIDNIAPTADMPESLNSWHWFFGDDERTFTISNISELVDEGACKVYDNGAEVPFDYCDADNTITFKLSKGWHNVGFVLVDMAGNTNNIQEKTNIHIGFFWLWIIIASAVLIITAVVCIVIHNRNRKKRELEAI